jgi:hypothetical protein
MRRPGFRGQAEPVIRLVEAVKVARNGGAVIVSPPELDVRVRRLGGARLGVKLRLFPEELLALFDQSPFDRGEADVHPRHVHGRVVIAEPSRGADFIQIQDELDRLLTVMPSTVQVKHEVALGQSATTISHKKAYAAWRSGATPQKFG